MIKRRAGCKLPVYAGCDPPVITGVVLILESLPHLRNERSFLVAAAALLCLPLHVQKKNSTSRLVILPLLVLDVESKLYLCLSDCEKIIFSLITVVYN